MLHDQLSCDNTRYNMSSWRCHDIRTRRRRHGITTSSTCRFLQKNDFPGTSRFGRCRQIKSGEVLKINILGALPPPNGGVEWREQKAGERGAGEIWGGCPLPSRLGVRGVSWAPPGGWDPAGNTFWRILKATVRSFCTYMPMLWVYQIMFHVTFGGNCPQQKTAPDQWHQRLEKLGWWSTGR